MIPEKKVNTVCVSNYSKELINKLYELNIKPIITVKSSLLDMRINYHTDMLVNIIGNTVFLDVSQNSNIVNFLTKGYRIIKVNKRVMSPYPNDSLLNFAVIGNKLVCNKKTIYNEIIEIAVRDGYKIMNVNQGYAKCSTCVINNNALITDDESIYTSTQKNGIDSILISKGSVKLDGFDYGFIGGCTGLIDKNKLLFNGDINYHKNCNLILDFLTKHGVEPVIIKNKPLTDIGSIIPIEDFK